MEKKEKEEEREKLKKEKEEEKEKLKKEKLEEKERQKREKEMEKEEAAKKKQEEKVTTKYFLRAIGFFNGINFTKKEISNSNPETEINSFFIFSL